MVSELTGAHGTDSGTRHKRRLAMPALSMAAAAAALLASPQTAHAFIQVGTIAGNDVFTNSTTTASTWYWDGANITISGYTSAGAGNEYGIWIYSGTNATNLITIASSATVSGGTIAIGNFGTISALNNAGTIVGQTSYALLNEGTINTITNSGQINTDVSNNAIRNTGNIGTLSNSGVISSPQDAIYNTGSIGTLSNSGTISAAGNAIYNGVSGSLGTITNSGLITGTITNLSSGDLSIDGGTGSTFGTLTGASSVGSIANTASNVVFGSGNLLLNDNIDVGTYSVKNTGATLQVNAPMTITGNYSQSADATLLVGVANGAVATGTISSDSSYGRLVVSGGATIASGSAVDLTKLDSYSFAAGQRFVVIQASSTGTDYNESTLNYSASGFTGTITGTDVTSDGYSDLVLTLSSGASSASGSNLATLPNSKSSLGGLDNYTGLDPALLNLYDASLALGGTSSANKAGAQLCPVQAISATAAAAAPAFDVMNLVASHSDTLRLAQNDGSSSGISTGDDPLDWTTWGQVFGGRATQGARDQVDGYVARYAGVLAGVDRMVNDHWRAGSVFSYDNTHIDGQDNTSGNSTRVDAYGLTGYASYEAESWYANLSAGYVQQQFHSTRQVDFSGFSGVASGQFDGQQYVARAEAGMPLTAGDLTLTPLGSLTYSHEHQNGYAETGGNGAALDVDDASASSVRSALGGRIEKSYDTAYGKLVPELQVQWIHEFDNQQVQTNASYEADTTGQTAFTTVGATPQRDLADVSLGLTLLGTRNLSVMADFEWQHASGFTSETGSLRLRQLF